MADNYVVVTTDGNKIFRAREVEGILYPVHKNEAIGEVGDEAQYTVGGDASAIALLKGLLGQYTNQSGGSSPFYTMEGDNIAMLLRSIANASQNTPLGTDVFHDSQGYGVFTNNSGQNVLIDESGFSMPQILNWLLEKIETIYTSNTGNYVYHDDVNNPVFTDNTFKSVFKADEVSVFRGSDGSSVFMDDGDSTAYLLRQILDASGGGSIDWNSIVKDGNGESVFYSNWTQKSLVEWMNRLVGNTTSYGDASYPVSPLFNSFGSSLSGFFGNETDEAAVAYNDAVSMMSFTKYMTKLLEEIRDASGGGGTNFDDVIYALGDPSTASSTTNLNELLYMLKQATIDSSNGYTTPDWMSGNGHNGDAFNPFWTSNGATAVGGGNMQPYLKLIMESIGTILENQSGYSLHDMLYLMITDPSSGSSAFISQTGTRTLADMIYDMVNAIGTVDAVSSAMNLNDVIYDQSTMMSQALISGGGVPFLEDVLAALGGATPYLSDMQTALNNMNPATDQIAADISAMRVILEDVYDATSHSIKMTSV